MHYPKLEPTIASRQTLSVFGGLNGNARIGEGELARMENFSSDGYPLLTPRPRRGCYARGQEIGGLIGKDGLCYVNGSKFVINGCPVELGLTAGRKQLVSMGAYVVIFPDKKYINTLDLSDSGNLEAEFTAQNAVCTPAFPDGSRMTPAYIQPEPPENPESMALWLDNSTGALMQWSAGSGMWVSVDNTWVKISAPNIGKAFRAGDGIQLTGQPEGVGSSGVISMAQDDFLLVPGLLGQEITVPEIRAARRTPEMDFVIECANRLWGCRYGVDANGQVVNEIYASKLGDFRNWECFEGVSTDSYRVSLGADGCFTGAITHLGYPIFFRENCLHKLYGSYPANFRLQTTPCRGVQQGCSESLAIVGEVLYYKSRYGVCAYDGSLPVEVGQALGNQPYHDAAGGGHGGKYYLSMADAGGEYHLFVLDTVRKLWHREDGTRVLCFCSCRGELYFLTDSGEILTAFGSGEPEGRFHWMAETGDLGVENPGSQYLCRLTLRLRLEKEGWMELWVKYDEEQHWQRITRIRGRELGSLTLPLGVRRCDHLRLKLEGEGDMTLYSLTKTLEEGSDVF